MNRGFQQVIGGFCVTSVGQRLTFLIDKFGRFFASCCDDFAGTVRHCVCHFILKHSKLRPLSVQITRMVFGESTSTQENAGDDSADSVPLTDITQGRSSIWPHPWRRKFISGCFLVLILFRWPHAHVCYEDTCSLFDMIGDSNMPGNVKRMGKKQQMLRGEGKGRLAHRLLEDMNQSMAPSKIERQLMTPVLVKHLGFQLVCTLLGVLLVVGLFFVRKLHHRRRTWQ